MPLFHERMETLLDYLPGRLGQPGPPGGRGAGGAAGDDRGPLRRAPAWCRAMARCRTGRCRRSGCISTRPAGTRCWPAARCSPSRPFAKPDGAVGVDGGGRPGPVFFQAAAARAPTCSTSCAARPSAGAARGGGSSSPPGPRGSRERLANLLREHGFQDAAQEDDWAAIRRKPVGSVSLVTLGVERGFVADQLALVGEQDLLGERISRPPRRRKRADQFIAEATEIAEGDLVVHQEYGIGRYDGLETLHRHRRAA